MLRKTKHDRQRLSLCLDRSLNAVKVWSLKSYTVLRPTPVCLSWYYKCYFLLLYLVLCISFNALLVSVTTFEVSLVDDMKRHQENVWKISAKIYKLLKILNYQIIFIPISFHCFAWYIQNIE
jgi:hypothetical protein